MGGEAGFSTVDTSTHELAERLHISDYSVDHARQDLKISRRGPLSEADIKRIIEYKTERDLEYASLRVMDKAPIGYYLTTHDIMQIIPGLKQGNVVSKINCRLIDGVRVKNGNGYSWYCTPESVKRYCAVSGTKMSKKSGDVISEARSRDLRNVIFENQNFQSALNTLGKGFEETLEIVIRTASEHLAKEK